MRSPWRFPTCGTLTGHTRFLVRRQDPADGSHTVRLMSGVEAMRAIGWDLGDWRGPPGGGGKFKDGLLRSLAGNAFSGYQAGPILAATMASFQAAEECLILPKETEEDADAASSDDAETQQQRFF